MDRGRLSLRLIFDKKNSTHAHAHALLLFFMFFPFILRCNVFHDLSEKGFYIRKVVSIFKTIDLGGGSGLGAHKRALCDSEKQLILAGLISKIGLIT